MFGKIGAYGSVGLLILIIAVANQIISIVAKKRTK